MLGLVKAQMVKNSVIVPVGAKGGFVCKIDLVGMTKADYMDFVKACYETFIRALLDLTDNRLDGVIVAPEKVIRYDDDDPYLVVAADKGTATFSDFANSIAAEYNHWLGDAFASGGINGYDHKKMGITAKGAWQSAKRLFIELGKNIDKDVISVVGVGDMSGDVFGNGMLLSDQLQLIAAFNHRHIFIDPAPNPEKSFKERQRLFEQPYSSWSDYRPEVLSEGGAIFERSQKVIQLSNEAVNALGLSANEMAPDELIKYILCANVDMLWNGGIGTYVKGSDETDIDVSDKANDRVRINASDLQAKVFAEGGNLGLTQKARVEFALKGGLIHMDAVDNSAGVDCSDHEVNIKILLDDVIKDGIISEDDRNRLLADMAPSVSSMVLNNNFRQSKMLSQSNYTAPYFFDSFVQLINLLERDGVLDREMACIPLPEEIEERISSQQYFTRPELATLLAYSKTRLFKKLATSTLVEESFFQNLLLNYFPQILVDKYSSYIKNHPLKKEILASYLTNDVANRTGATFCNYILEENKVDIARLVKAHITAVEIFDLNGLYRSIDDLVYSVDSHDLLDLQLAIHYPLDKAMSWLMQENMNEDVSQIASAYKIILSVLKEKINVYLPEQDYNEFNDLTGLSENKGIPRSLAEDIYSLNYYYYVLPLGKVINDFDVDLEEVMNHFFRIGEELNIFWLYQLIDNISIDDNWKRKNKKILIATIEEYHIKALRVCLSGSDRNKPIIEVLPEARHYVDMIGLAKSKPTYNFSMVTVLASQLGQSVH